VTTCVRCGVAVVCGTTLSGKRLQLNAAPSEKGTFSLSREGYVEIVSKPDGRALHEQHTSTCVGSSGGLPTNRKSSP
jgi:hypothetical protein